MMVFGYLTLISIDFFNFVSSVFSLDLVSVEKIHVLPHFQTRKICRWVLFFQLSC